MKVPFGLDPPYWIEDPEFDIEFHVRHIALSKPGDWRQLCIQAPRSRSSTRCWCAAGRVWRSKRDEQQAPGSVLRGHAAMNRRLVFDFARQGADCELGVFQGEVVGVHLLEGHVA